ncbi:MAG: GNAT family N-acetyltransferase, partial [Candidatus Hodarchaeota archaeon]
MPTQQNPTIRQARPTDKEELVKMRLSMQEHMEASSPRIWRMTDEGRRSIAEDVEQMLSDEEGMVLVAEEDGAVVGYTHGHVAHRVEYVPSGVGFIHGIYVQEPSRR